MKYFDLNFSDERLMQIFSKYDEDGSAELDIQEFENAFNFLKNLISKECLQYLG